MYDKILWEELSEEQEKDYDKLRSDIIDLVAKAHLDPANSIESNNDIAAILLNVAGIVFGNGSKLKNDEKSLKALLKFLSFNFLEGVEVIADVSEKQDIELGEDLREDRTLN